MNKYKQYLIPIVIAALIGFATGIAGFAASRYYLSNIILGDLYLPNNDQVGQKEVVIKDAKNVVVDQDVQTKQLFDKSAKAIFGVYRKKPASKSLVDQIYSKNDLISQAVAVTSDGWLATYIPFDVTEKNIVLAKDDKVYEVKKVISDPTTKIKFIQVDSLSAPVIEFASRQSITNGQTVVIPDQVQNSLTINHLENISYRKIGSKSDLLESVENYDQRILLSQDLSDDFLGAPVLSLNGEIVGIFQGGRQAIKVNYLNSLLKSVLKNDKLTKPYLGINYISLYNAVGTTSFGDGVQLARNTSGITVRPDSPFSKSLLEGDIILSIEGQKITSENTFADLIYDYRPGNVLKFKIKRQDQELEIEKAIAEK